MLPRRCISCTKLLALALAAALLPARLANVSPDATFVVDTGDEFSAAVAQLKDRDTIQVNSNMVLNGTVALKLLANITIKSTPPHKYTINGGGFQCFSIVESGVTIENIRVANCHNTISDFGGAFDLQHNTNVTALNVDTVSNYALEGSGWYVFASELSYRGGNVSDNQGQAIVVYKQATVELSDLNFTSNDIDVHWWSHYAHTNAISISRCNITPT
jgi:hypothetical protein